MAVSGILREDDRLELIEGEIIEMTPIGRHHASCVARLTQHFAALAAQGVAVVWEQMYARSATFSVPRVVRSRPASPATQLSRSRVARVWSRVLMATRVSPAMRSKC